MSQDDIRRETLNLLKWNRHEQSYAAPPAGPTLQELEGFTKGLIPGPTVNDFKLDLRKLDKDDPESKLQRLEGTVWPYPPDVNSQPYIAQRFQDKIRHLKDVHQLQMRLSVATEQERQVILGEIHDSQKGEWYRSRCVELYELRIRILEFHKDVPEVYMNLVKALGIDGMSSDETDTECKVKPFRFYRIPKPWRSAIIDRILFVIDKLYARPNVLGAHPARGGNSCCIRIGNHREKVHLGPVPQYPSTFFDMWFFIQRPGALQVLQSTPEWNQVFILPEPFFNGLSDFEVGFKPFEWAGYGVGGHSTAPAPL
ncbi:hypothetical protein M422DRAFT_243815 [Sphaerobolus stellatus SS14]|nr:hypothetical protein M422DRAFT_243815 [Sphaerobolus stellatus SS14]